MPPWGGGDRLRLRTYLETGFSGSSLQALENHRQLLRILCPPHTRGKREGAHCLASLCLRESASFLDERLRRPPSLSLSDCW